MKMKQTYGSNSIVFESKFKEHTREEVTKVVQHNRT